MPHCHTCPKCNDYFVCDDTDCSDDQLCIECALSDTTYIETFDVHEVFALLTVLAQLIAEYEKDTDMKPSAAEQVMFENLVSVKAKLDKSVYHSYVSIKNEADNAEQPEEGGNDETEA